MPKKTFSRKIVQSAYDDIMQRDETGNTLDLLHIIWQDTEEATKGILSDMLQTDQQLFVVTYDTGINLYDPANYNATGRWVGRIVQMLDHCGNIIRAGIEDIFDTYNEAREFVTDAIPQPYVEPYTDTFTAPDAKSGATIYGTVYAETVIKPELKHLTRSGSIEWK